MSCELRAQVALFARRNDDVRTLPGVRACLGRSRESIFTAVNLDSGRRKAGRKAKQTASEALRSQLRETVRAAILDAAEERIAAQGLHGTSLVEIAKAAGVAVGTLYNYFEDRDAMVRALFETRRATLQPKIQAAIKSGVDLDFEPRMRRFMRELFEAFESHHRYVQVVFQAEHLKPTASHADLVAAIDEMVAAGVREGVIAKATADTLSVVLAGSIRAVLLRRSQRGGSFVLDADPICTLLLDGARRR